MNDIVPYVVTVGRKNPFEIRLYKPKPRKKDGVFTLRRVRVIRFELLMNPEQREEMSHFPGTSAMRIMRLWRMAQSYAKQQGWIFKFHAYQGMTMDKLPDSYQALVELNEVCNRED